ncbi:MAG TPA: serine/threonine protein kinase [Planctomycetaceae bacterium]|nr:serine/threonine protein kinase [Planctomycetaceae bacterium]|tara:strand:- start:3700 stop:5151 length:1452 start_codon:yes stop_codon:yes gene_type:complete
MAAPSLNEFAKQLVHLRLADAGELQQCLGELPTALRTTDGLIDAMERRNLLTTYQANKLRKGDTNGFVLGDAKLLYRNGAGTFARVFRAVSLETGDMLGVKVLRQRWAEDPEAVAQFHREAKLLQPLRHPNLVPIFDVGIVENYHYFTMEFVVGGNLGDMMKIRGAVDPANATRIARDIAEGLRYSSTKGLTHRDLKKTNVLLATDGKAKLVDFGLAADEALKPGGTKKRAARSVDYATLEDNTGAPPNDPRSDIYFLGSIYYELLSGESPFPGTKSREERKEFSRFRNVRPINTIRPGLPVYVVEAVDRLMDLNPLSRFQSPEQASQALNQVIERLGGSSSSDPDSGTETGDTEPTLLFVENRPPQQELIRDFFTSRGFRVLLVGDLQRALNRLNSSPPDCLVMMGGAIGSEIVTGFKESARRTDGRPIAQIAVLSKDQAAWEKRLGALVSETARVMAHPIVLGDLKQEIQSALAACSGSSA